MILGPDGNPASDAGLMISCEISGRRRNVELVKMNKRTCWVRVGGARPAIIKRHLSKHRVSA